MPRLLRSAALLMAVLVAAGVPASAASGQPRAASGGRHGPPDQIAGLDVEKEDVAKVLASDKRALYVDRIGLYSLREHNKLLQATLQVARFRPDAPWTSRDFQLSIVGRLGGSVPIVVRVDNRPVYITTSKGLTLAIWFKNDHLMAMSIRRTYPQPKQLLRQALEINP